MTTRTNRALRLAACAGFLLFGVGCATFELDDHHSFADWYVGDPGFDGAFGTKTIYAERPAIYGHFRLPEVVFQPVGGLHYPRRRVNTDRGQAAAMEAWEKAQRTGQAVQYQRETTVVGGHEKSFWFDTIDAGVIEIVPYRLWASDASAGEKVVYTLLQPGVTLVNACMTFVRAPIYAYLDVDKLLSVPVALLYYGSEEEE
ncbi:MAG: hypothetical protein AAF430_03670 [Myxococcota bacterium]